MKAKMKIAMLAVCAGTSYAAGYPFGDWPEGKDPASVSRKVSDLFLTTEPDVYKPTGYSSPSGYCAQGYGRSHLHYSVVSLWLNLVEIARQCGDDARVKRLVDAFEPFYGSKKDKLMTVKHVDFNVAGALPLEIAIATGDERARRLGLWYADRQWEEPKKDDVVQLWGELLPFEERMDWWRRGYTDQSRMWIDDMYMITVLQSQAYRLTGDRKYIDRAAREMCVYLDRLQIKDGPDAGLFHHGPDAPFVWGRGAGWMAAGMPLLLKYLPDDSECRAKIMSGYLAMMKALKARQCESGMWNQLVGDAESWEEPSATAMFGYAFIEGVNQGWLDAAEYGEPARRAYLAVVGMMDEHGNVRDVCAGTPKKNDRQHYLDRPRVDGDPHAQAPLMWMCLALLEGQSARQAEFPEWSAPRAVTQGPHEHFLASYFAIDSWSPNKRYLLALETDLNGRLPEAGERCTLGVVDLVDGNRFIPFTTTACWNFQEAAMAFWIDDETVLFNDVRDGKFRTVVMKWRTGEEVRVLPMPVSAVSEDRTWAVSVNYARLSLTRPDYGYAGPGQDARAGVESPDDDGLWTMDLKTGATKMILSVAAGKPQFSKPSWQPAKPGRQLSYYCHTVISKDGKKIFFLARTVDLAGENSREVTYWETTSFTIDRDGGNLRRCFRDGWQGSHFNWAPDGSHKMLVTAVWDGDTKGRGWEDTDWSLVEFEVGRECEVRRIGAGILDKDWHCVYSPDGKFMSGEGYWNKNFERAWVLVRLSDGMTMPMGSFFVPEKYRGGYWRCDLHARYRPDGRQIAFNSVHEGSRQIYVRDIKLKQKGGVR